MPSWKKPRQHHQQQHVLLYPLFAERLTNKAICCAGPYGSGRTAYSSLAASGGGTDMEPLYISISKSEFSDTFGELPRL